MLEGLWYFRCLFFMELVHGIYNPSLTDLGHSTWKKVYCLFILITVCGFNLWFLITFFLLNGFNTLAVFLVFIRCFTTTYFVMEPLVDFKTKVSGALNLAEIEKLKHLKKYTKTKKMMPCLFCAFLLLIIVVAYLHTITWSFTNSVIDNLGILHSAGLSLSLFLGCFGYLMKIFLVKRTTSEYLQEEVDTIFDEALRLGEGSYRRKAWPQLRSDCINDVLSVMRRTGSVIYQTSEELTSWYRMYMVWSTFIASIITPIHGLNAVKVYKHSVAESLSSMSASLFILVTNVAIILCCEQIKHTDNFILSNLSSLLSVTESQVDKSIFKYQYKTGCLSGGSAAINIFTHEPEQNRDNLTNREGTNSPEFRQSSGKRPEGGYIGMQSTDIDRSKHQSRGAQEVRMKNKHQGGRKVLTHRTRRERQKERKSIAPSPLNTHKHYWKFMQNYKRYDPQEQGPQDQSSGIDQFEDSRNLSLQSRSGCQNDRNVPTKGDDQNVNLRAQIGSAMSTFQEIGRDSSDISRSFNPDRIVLRHHLLAGCHRRFNYNCYFFDLGYPLLAIILDTSLLVICTMMSD